MLENVKRETKKTWGHNWLFAPGIVYMVKSKLIGIVFIPCGLLIVGAYIHLLYGVSTGNADNLPKGACKWCCYGPPVWSCIENYRQELSSERFHPTETIQA